MFAVLVVVLVVLSVVLSDAHFRPNAPHEQMEVLPSLKYQINYDVREMRSFKKQVIFLRC